MITWSHSSLKMFETCARQYHEIRVMKRYKREETEQALYGTALHEAAELYVKDKTPFAQDFAFMQPIADAMLAKPGQVFVEHEMALDAGLFPCAWDDKKAWVRGIADLLIVDNAGRRAWCIDYKTGNDRYADTDQLDLMSLLIFQHFPGVLRTNGALLFVLKNNMVKHKVLRENLEKLWWEYRQRVAKIESAMITGVWNPTQSGLCKKYCSVLSCEFNGRH